MNIYEKIQKISTDLIDAIFAGTPPSGDIVEWARRIDKKSLGQQIFNQTQTAWLAANESACTLIRTESKVPENLAMTQQMAKAKIGQFGSQSFIEFCNMLIERKGKFEVAAQQLEEYKDGIREAGMNDWMTGANQTRMLAAGYGNSDLALVGSVAALIKSKKNTSIRKQNYEIWKNNLAIEREQLEQNEIFELIDALKKMPGEFAEMLVNLVEGGNVDPVQRDAVERNVSNALKAKITPLSDFLTAHAAACEQLAKEYQAERAEKARLQAIIQAKRARKIAIGWGIALLIIGTLLGIAAITNPNNATVPLDGLAGFMIPIGLMCLVKRLHIAIKVISVIIGFAIIVTVIGQLGKIYEKGRDVIQQQESKQKLQEINNQDEIALAENPELVAQLNQITKNAFMVKMVVVSAKYKWNLYQKNNSESLEIKQGDPHSGAIYNIIDRAQLGDLQLCIDAANKQLAAKAGKTPTAAEPVHPLPLVASTRPNYSVPETSAATPFETKLRAALQTASSDAGTRQYFFDTAVWVLQKYQANPNAPLALEQSVQDDDRRYAEFNRRINTPVASVWQACLQATDKVLAEERQETPITQTAAPAPAPTILAAADYDQKVKSGLAGLTQNTVTRTFFFDLYTWMTNDHELNPNAAENIQDVIARQPTLNEIYQKQKARVGRIEWNQCCDLINEVIAERIAAQYSSHAAFTSK